MYLSEVKGKGGIVARVVAASQSAYCDTKMTTFEIEFPRFILAEVNTHCMLEKNAASSRAIPVAKMLENLKENHATPIHWGKNQAGMVADKEVDAEIAQKAKELWESAFATVDGICYEMIDLGIHKQVANRLNEPFQIVKMVISGTEWNNFFYLRMHEDADPHFQELARCMYEAASKAEYETLYEDEWHVPYVRTYREANGKRYYLDNNGDYISAFTARQVSASCCAQVSYRKCDDSIEKAEAVFDKLNIGSKTKPAHASPTTHQATPMNLPTDVKTRPDMWPEGVTHIDRYYDCWSGKLKNWIQFRKLIANESKRG